MEIIVSGRHYQVTPEFKNYAEELISATFTEIPVKATHVRLVMTAEKERCKADVVVAVKGHDVEASSEANEMGKAIAEAVEKAGKQVRKHLDKIQDHKKRVPVKEAEAQKAEIEAAAE